MLALFVLFKMFSSPLCVITCSTPFMLALLGLDHLVWLSLFCLHLCIFIYLFMYVSSCACLCHQAQFLPITSCQFTPIFVRQILSPFQELCSMAQISSVLQYNGTMDIKSKPTFVLLGHPLLLVCLITCLFAPLSTFFPCLLVLCVCLVLSLFLCYLFGLSAGFVFSLFVVCTHLERGCNF